MAPVPPDKGDAVAPSGRIRLGTSSLAHVRRLDPQHPTVALAHSGNVLSGAWTTFLSIALGLSSR
jgi:hypothetical protein